MAQHGEEARSISAGGISGAFFHPLERIGRDGRYSWLATQGLAPYGEWTDVGGLVPHAGGVLVVRAATSFPTLPTGWKHHGFGAPRKPREIPELVAWLADCTQLSQRQAMRLLYPDQWDDGEEKAKSAHKYDRDIGREHLHDRGVGPWAAWDKGNVPDAWWEQSPWREWLTKWLCRAWIERKLGATAPTPRIVAMDTGQSAAHRAYRMLRATERRTLALLSLQIRLARPALVREAEQAVPEWRFDEL